MTTIARTAAMPQMEIACLRDWIGSGREIALLDIREHGQYGESHLFFAVNVPFSRLETEAFRLVPHRNVLVVVYDDGESGLAELAAQRLSAAGYSDVRILAGGTAAWQAAGHGLFAGVNLPSKTFGELAEQVYDTPYISADALFRKQAAGENLVVLDGRPFHEYQKMSIPGAVSCPNGELALRVAELVPDPETTVVINCAGRTRSIIGAQTLINLGLPNVVLALQNGTQGWMLADHQLAHGASLRHCDDVAPGTLALSQSRADALAGRAPVRRIDAETLSRWRTDPERTTYVCDIRSPEEMRQDSRPGLCQAPGGQLIQATDLYLGTRGARVVLLDTDGIRAPVVANWLWQMGWDVHLVGDEPRITGWTPEAPVLPVLRAIDAATIAAAQASLRIIDLRSSMLFRKDHLVGADWSTRQRLAADLAGENRPVVLVVDAAPVAAMATLELRGDRDIRVHVADRKAWEVHDLETEGTPDVPPDADCVDYLFFVHDRHDGNRQAALQYLKWETDLLSQVDALEQSFYRLPERSPTAK